MSMAAYSIYYGSCRGSMSQGDTDLINFNKSLSPLSSPVEKNDVPSNLYLVAGLNVPTVRRPTGGVWKNNPYTMSRPMMLIERRWRRGFSIIVIMSGSPT